MNVKVSEHFSEIRKAAGDIALTGLICLMLVAWYDFGPMLVLWISLLLISYFRTKSELIIIGFNLFLFLSYSGPYRFIQIDFTGARTLNIFMIVVFFLFSYFFIFKLKRWRLTFLISLMASLYLGLYLLPKSPVKYCILVLLMFLCFNFFILLKESDNKNENKNLFGLLVSLNPAWNFPFFLNLSYRQLLSYRFKNYHELIESRKSAAAVMLRVYPAYLTLNYFLYVLINKTFVPNDVIYDLFRLRFRSTIFDQLSSLHIFTNAGHNYLFAILLGGVTYAVGLIYMVSCGACLVKAFGFNVPYVGFSIEKMSSLSGFLSQMYYFYNKSIVETVYTRLLKFFKKIQLPEVFSKRTVIIFIIVTFGGMISNFMTDTVFSLRTLGIEVIFFNTVKSIPYFLLFSLSVVLGTLQDPKGKEGWKKRILRILIYFIGVSFLYSLRRLVLFQKGIEEFVSIWISIFRSFIP